MPSKEKKPKAGAESLPATQPQSEAPDNLQELRPVLIARTPEELVDRAKAYADALIPIIEKQHLYVTINDKKFVRVEAWTTLGAMLNIFPYVEYTRKVDGGGITWESRVLIKNLDGQVISSAEAMCSSEEPNWRGRAEFAIRSMAQTRAVSKALRLPLAFIVTLAGYEPTPAEEMESGWHKKEKSNGMGEAIDKLAKTKPLPKTEFRIAFRKNLDDWGLTPEQAQEIIAEHLKVEAKQVKFAGNTYKMLNLYNAILLYHRMQEKEKPKGKKEIQEPKETQKSKKPSPAKLTAKVLDDLKGRVLGCIPEGATMPNDMTLRAVDWAKEQIEKRGTLEGLKKVIPFVRLHMPADLKAELRKYAEFQGALGGAK